MYYILINLGLFILELYMLEVYSSFADDKVTA